MDGFYRVNLFILQFIYIKHLYTNSRFRFKTELNKWGVHINIGKGPYKRSHQLRLYLGISEEGIRHRRMMCKIKNMKPVNVNILREVLKELKSQEEK